MDDATIAEPTRGLVQDGISRDGILQGAAAAPAARPRRPVVGLSGRLLVLTIAFVMLAEVLIYVPSVANFQRSWLSDRLAAAQIAALVLDAGDADMPGLQEKLLAGVGAELVAVRGGGTRRLLAVDVTMPPEVVRTVDLRTQSPLEAIPAAFATLVGRDPGMMRVVGDGTGPNAAEIDFVEIVIDPAPLREALFGFSRNILILSLIISGITAGLVYLSLQAVIVRPVRRLSANLERFSEEPEDASRIIAPSRRTDEIGTAERALERTERALAEELRTKRRLAELGLGVAKINHDLRNMLASAQLISDRLADVEDPTVQRIAPRLIGTLQRAIDFSEATLAYGRAVEPAPSRRVLPLVEILADLHAVPGLAAADAQALPRPAGEGAARLELDVAPDVTIDADREQLARVLVNLARNAVQAMVRLPAEERVLRISARRADGACIVEVCDSGPGLPAKAREHLFEPFKGAARASGTGLGLAICAEIVRLHGGRIVHDVDPARTLPGAAFRIEIPDRPRDGA
ncbi:sensor histidine kinase [Salinarimonas rosea]|uniref:sensor histidine kinase n=1 Tax=Salinarimonas rosea TaxID=552063 RepID=UPI0003FAB729|nr:HAMP domain-containing sensor histidine kinase [Salinarimonas rosea]